MIEPCHATYLSSQRRKRSLAIHGQLFAAVLVTAKSLGMTVEETPKG
jgi:hypothetical protein